MALFIGRRINQVCTVEKDGHPLSPRWSLSLRNHSPAGFNWGYSGSGPAQLALALLLEETTVKEALHLYQPFKRAVVSRFEGDRWQATSEGFQTILAKLRETHPYREWEEEEVEDEA